MDRREKEIKASLRVTINRGLLSMSFTILTLIISINPSLLQESVLIPLQLAISIPLLLSSSFARTKLAYTKNPGVWDKYGFFTFLIGYSFLINVLGIFLLIYVNLAISLIYFMSNIFVSVLYSFFEVIDDKSKLKSRIKKDLLFIVLLILGGVLPTLIIY